MLTVGSILLQGCAATYEVAKGMLSCNSQERGMNLEVSDR